MHAHACIYLCLCVAEIRNAKMRTAASPGGNSRLERFGGFLPLSAGISPPTNKKRLGSRTPGELGEARVHRGFYFVCDHGKYRSSKRYHVGCNMLLGGEMQVTPSIVPLRKHNLTMTWNYTSKVEPPTYSLREFSPYETGRAGRPPSSSNIIPHHMILNVL